MDKTQIADAIASVEQLWEISLAAERELWESFFEPLESIRVASALVELYSSNPRIPTQHLILETYTKIDALAATSPHVRTAAPEPVEFVREMEPWVKGWAVARYRHDDMRIFPQQQDGYYSLQTANPHSRSYVWPEQEMMPPEDIERYIAEGAPLKASEIVQLIGEP